MLLALLFIASVGVYFLIFGVSHFAPSLLQGIAHTPYPEREEFRARVLKDHPPGSDAATLQDFLRSQGFEPSVSREDGVTAYHYSMMIAAFCSGIWDVEWRADAQGKLVKIDTYAQDACL